ncbi:VOC family protein [Micromonospora sp. WMMD1155]|uniref:VOC family protein n=1 Tax=Micromonospora sp. WMMD1155 TaxID=3016094 RepID=UPI00249A61B0|nr:VOC family protein [Micromonospora sp. WMMD1155]WFE49659.1 VOC family protein [Micromonospora sp. WMMD1155]
MTVQIPAERFHAADGVEDWRCLYHLVSAYFPTGSLSVGIALVDEMGRLAVGDEREHLNVDLRHAGVTVSLSRRDISLARRISAAARALGIPADPTAVQLINITLDALSTDVLPFWQALLGYRPIGDDYLADPARRGPGFGLQPMEAVRPHRNRMHLDIAVAHDQAEGRIAAALAAGGRVVSDAHAPMWWVLADPEGNEACIATWLGRE